MASLKDTQQLTQDLERLVGELQSELQNGEVDFEHLVGLADQISERADGMAETFNSVNDALMQRIQQVQKGGSGSSSRSGSSSSRKQQAKSGSRG